MEFFVFMHSLETKSFFNRIFLCQRKENIIKSIYKATLTEAFLLFLQLRSNWNLINFFLVLFS